MPNAHDPETLSDALIAGGLVAAPAWSAWLSQFNELLSTGTLLLGFALGCCRLWAFLRRQRASASKRTD